MNEKILSVTFEVVAQRYKNGRFSVPQSVCEILNIRSGDNIIVEINNNRFDLKLTSGREVDSSELSQVVKAREKIQVKISRA
jgi:hypothetical protein